MTTNTTNTTKDTRLDTNAAAIKPSMASKTQPESATAPTTAEPDLQSRIEVRRVALVAALREHRADMHLDAIEAGDEVKAKLSELSNLIKMGVVDSWATVNDTTKRKLERWLKESARHVLTQDARAGQS
jgi:hypothetical protein